MKCLVLSAKPYSFESKDGRKIEGCKVSYINKKPKEHGHDPLIVNINNSDSIELIKGNVPGLFDLEFEQVVGKNNKPEIVLSDLEPISPIDLTSLF